MTDIEKALAMIAPSAFYEINPENVSILVNAFKAAIEQHEALEAENKRLREALRTVEQGVPRPVGKSWFPDGRPSKHDQCVHGIWMYEPCEGCTDAFIAEALGETK